MDVLRSKIAKFSPRGPTMVGRAGVPLTQPWTLQITFAPPLVGPDCGRSRVCSLPKNALTDSAVDQPMADLRRSKK